MSFEILRLRKLAKEQGLRLYTVHKPPIRRYVLSREDWGDGNIDYLIYSRLGDVEKALRYAQV